MTTRASSRPRRIHAVAPPGAVPTGDLLTIDSLFARGEGGSRSLVLRSAVGATRNTVLEASALRARGAGWRVLRVAGVSAETELAFSALHQLLNPLRSSVHRLPVRQRQAVEQAFGLVGGPPPSRFVISAAALALVETAAATEGRLVLIVDDADRIDRCSAEVLGFVARRLAGERVVFLAGANTGPPSSLTAGLPQLQLRPQLELVPASLPIPLPAREGERETLTGQEQQIAELAAQGLTNKQIADQLFLSHRTVGTHLYKLFPKLGISSRAALRDALADRRS
jgi:DNA-binding CsgD family transcriptional regulator